MAVVCPLELIWALHRETLGREGAPGVFVDSRLPVLGPRRDRKGDPLPLVTCWPGGEAPEAVQGLGEACGPSCMQAGLSPSVSVPLASTLHSVWDSHGRETQAE